MTPFYTYPEHTPGRTEAIVVRDVVELLGKPRGRDVTHGGRIRTGLSSGTPAGGSTSPSTAHCAQWGLQQSYVM